MAKNPKIDKCIYNRIIRDTIYNIYVYIAYIYILYFMCNTDIYNHRRP